MLEEARCIREDVEDLAHVQDEAVLQSLGVYIQDCSSDSGSDSDFTCDDPSDYFESTSTFADTLEEGIPVPGGESTNNSTIGIQDDDRSNIGALEDFPLMSIGTHSEWFNIVTEIELRVCMEQKVFFDTLYSK